MIEIIPYNNAYQEQWNAIIEQADNTHFMFKRSYVEYHSDRFIEASYLILKKGKLIGVIPGSKHDKQWVSHGGLTFGGIFVLPNYSRIEIYLSAYEGLWAILRQAKYESAFVKPVPWIYHRNPCEGEIYSLGQKKIINRYIEVSTAINLKNIPKATDLRVRSRKKAEKNNLYIEKSIGYESFWEILSKRLETKYTRKPVHTVEEIKLLQVGFPENIYLFVVKNLLGEVLGGTILFSTSLVDHAQYIASSQEGMEKGALDLLFFTLIGQAKNNGKSFFDFGISTEENGLILNKSLVSFKEGFGGRSIIHNKFRIQI